LADLFWTHLAENYPHVLGEINPFNEEIEKLQNSNILDCSDLE